MGAQAGGRAGWGRCVYSIFSPSECGSRSGPRAARSLPALAAVHLLLPARARQDVRQVLVELLRGPGVGVAHGVEVRLGGFEALIELGWLGKARQRREIECAPSVCEGGGGVSNSRKWWHAIIQIKAVRGVLLW